MSRTPPAVHGVIAPGRRPTPAYAFLLLRRMGVPILIVSGILELVAALLRV